MPTALVTGATAGIGASFAKALALRGYDLVLVARDEQRLRAMQLPTSVEVLAADLGDDEGCALVEKRCSDGVDLLVNNAGVEHPYELLEMPLKAWQKVIDVNLTGAFLCAREAARMMRDRKASGTIVNISSVHEQIAWERFSHYCASKGGMKLFAQSIAKELAPLGIRVVSVAPGAIDTPINRSVLEDPRQSATVLAEVPLGRWGHVSDIARAVAWLASDQASYVTGATLFVDGGMTLYPRFV
jgi:glucose 1-dehydrogenase